MKENAMSSILTNSSAMVALQTLKSVNNDLEATQSMISTGKEVATAKDNSSVWAISKVMESDVKGFEGISDSLALGESSVAVAANASETITDLLTDIKTKIVAAQGENVDRDKIQTDINKLTDQINSVVGAAQFNGMNLLKGTDDMNILSSLDRSSDGTVKASSISVSRQDMSTDSGAVGSTSLTAANYVTMSDAGGNAATATAATTGSVAAIDLDADGTLATSTAYSIDIAGQTIDFTTDGTTAESEAVLGAALAGKINALQIDGVTAAWDATDGTLDISNTNAFDKFAVTVSGGDAQIEELNGSTGLTQTSGDLGQRATSLDFDTSAGVAAGDGYKVSFGGESYTYVAGKGESMEDIAKGLKVAIDGKGTSGVTTKVTQDATSGQWGLSVDDADTGGQTITLNVTSGGTASGGMFGLGNIDVTTDAGAASALTNIETLINSSVDAAAEFGSARSQIDTQSDFVTQLTSSLKEGIGGMVDANMEETSARLKALQTQQQLATQSLTIANQAPQSILSLFK
jgi:flagellin